MHELTKTLGRYLRVNLLGPGTRLIKENLPGRGLTKFEKHCDKLFRKVKQFPYRPGHVLKASGG